VIKQTLLNPEAFDFPVNDLPKTLDTNAESGNNVRSKPTVSTSKLNSLIIEKTAGNPVRNPRSGPLKTGF